MARTLAMDYYGISAVVAAVFAGIASVIGALNHRTTTTIQRQVDTGTGVDTIGQIAAGLGTNGTPPAPPASTTP
jgi:hypothetical protein